LGYTVVGYPVGSEQRAANREQPEMTVRVIPMSSGEYDVTVEGPVGVRSHRVVVGPNLLAALDVQEDRSEQVVAAAIDVLEDQHELRDLAAFVDLDAFRARREFVDAIRRRIA